MTIEDEPTTEAVAAPPRPVAIQGRRGGIEWVTARLGLPAILGAVILQQNLATLSSFERLQLFIAIFAGATVLSIAFEQSRTWSTFRKIALPAAAIVAIATSYVVFKPLPDEAANDKRCLAIQRDMLSSMPMRSDGPDLFQALGCRPQGEGSVYAERDTKEDTAAIMEQSIRRAELPYRNPYRNGDGAVLK